MAAAPPPAPPSPDWPPRPLTRLGRITVEQFMRTAWQRRPLLIRAALPEVTATVTREVLFALARRDDVESRLVTCFNGRWSLRQGPFASARALPPVSRAGWTLLVQGVDLYHAPAAALRDRFRFVPDARLDDVMVSWASDGGGVGAHIDSYDVFLLQARGRRLWRIGRQRDPRFVPGLPLRILASFRPTQEWLLEPGDLLYLPPGIAHEGTAIGSDCITCSIGFRAPAYRELLDPWFEALAARLVPRGRYRDAGLRPTRHPARLPAAMTAATAAALARLRPTRSDAARALLTQLSEPKSSVRFDPPARPLARRAFAAALARRGVAVDARTRMLYAGPAFAINGELSPLGALPAASRALLQRLADRRALAPADAGRLGREALALLYEWYVAGWLQLPPAPGEGRQAETPQSDEPSATDSRAHSD